MNDQRQTGLIERRLAKHSPELLDRESPISFFWNGRKLEGYQGDTLASALLANGEWRVAQSYKYGRGRGVYTSWVDEPNAIVSLESGRNFIPNAKATQVELYQNLCAQTPKDFKILGCSVKKIFKPFHFMMSAGFYYKIFMSPKWLWDRYESLLRSVAGISESPKEKDCQLYGYRNHFVDLLIIGGGITGLKAALVAVEKKQRVLLVDDRSWLGGSMRGSEQEIDGIKAYQWIEQACVKLESHDMVTVLKRTNAFARGDQNQIFASENRQDHLELDQRDFRVPRELYHRIRADKILLATGAQERLIAFQNNDLPGVMLASAFYDYSLLYSIRLGSEVVLFTNNNSVYPKLIEVLERGIKIKAVVDVRDFVEPKYLQILEKHGVDLYTNSVISEAKGEEKVTSVKIEKVELDGRQRYQLIPFTDKKLSCDLLAVSGGLNPVIHLSCHTGFRGYWNDSKLGFSGKAESSFQQAGSINFLMDPANCLRQAEDSVNLLLMNDSIEQPNEERNPLEDDDPYQVCSLFFSPNGGENKSFVDLQNDVTLNDIRQSVDENYRSIEHVKRYTALGFGTDQGKIGNVVGMAAVASLLNIPMAEVGTTTFRPCYSPITLGNLAGQHIKDLLDPIRYTPIHASHLANGADWENVGQWKRPWYFPIKPESIHQAVQRESSMIRKSVGLMDASTLGKIDIQGKDAREFLNRVYTNSWGKLSVGKCRYGVMLDEKGMVIDDGVTLCLADDHFFMTTTTGGAARVYSSLEMWLQTEWTDLEVYLTSVTDHWSTIAIVGPKSRDLVRKICKDIDFSAEQFKFMEWREGTVLDSLPARITRISFSGELAFEVNIQANHARYIWDALCTLGKEFDVVQYGTETMHVLRAEKGYIIVGQDTDGSQTPIDLNMSWLLPQKKSFSYIGKRSLSLPALTAENRKQLVGLYPLDKNKVLPEGAQFVVEKNSNEMIGHATSSYFSPTLQRSFAMALIRGGLSKMGQTIYAKTISGEVIPAEIVSSVFYDSKGEKQDG